MSFLIIWVWVLLAVTAFAAGLCLGGLLRQHRWATVRTPHTASSARDDRLVLACIELADQLTSEALRAQVHRALADVGVHAIAACGEPFSTLRHRAVDREPTDDPGRHGLVAAVVRPGYESGPEVLREAEVTVFDHTRTNEENRS
ncbi:nucleotide exchange factor GrpE [Nonomuraea sp. PA05]|uniref:nucleotide exchange factor GrpE n=1 Tax=Nonomuraea sp. PA05 TaxID=2604466 RepID=UPI0016521628|nr:nucleotide exchange factor GrpE [Nonomuraea sp. PA05]